MPPHLAADLPGPPSSPRSGIALYLAALVLFASFDAAVKHLLTLYPAPFLNVMRYLAVATIAICLVLRHGLPRLPATPDKGLLLLRGLMLGTVGTCFMTALIWMPLSEATAIYFTSPLIVVALSPWLLRERVGATQWAAVALGCAGMLLIVRPGNSLPWLGTVLMAVSAVSYALFQVLTRKLSGRVPSHVQYAYTAFVCLVITAVPAPFFLPAPWPDLRDSVVIVLLGITNGLGQVLLIAAFRRVPASTLAPFNYCHLLMAVAFSTFVFGRPPDLLAIAGMALIVTAGLFLVSRARHPGSRAKAAI
ncbi:DMT family transporter [Bordetella sp. BOR01]|uniref:DMT family transporter n=1 Tax=Bordetella sp. BOR01 TaxID=2854779 RepID=UPI001C495A22|nr:DMT family transporter [Bordetella sp. BOR01]MBV7487004.1 DMT family transporter [Bordetella sp. BOR01]